MCRTPNKLDDGTEVACRKCWQCKRNRVNDLVGRCIAESKFCSKTYAVTLTYANDAGVNAVTLVYKDVQDFLKRLRKRYNVRYIVAGEYGTAKGRAHWHIILFFKGEYPEIEEQVRVNWKYWHHGFSYFQQPDWKGFQYVLKYVLKDTDLDSADSHLAMSKKPPLGHEFFMDLAQTHVEQAVIPRSFKYKVGGVRKDNGTEKVFMMQGKTRENFMSAFKQGWIEKYGKEPYSEFHEEWDERNYPEKITPEGYAKKVLKMSDGRELSYKYPIFNEEQTQELIKRIHHKPVRYYEPWKMHETNNGEWIEINYQGTDLIMWKRDEGAWIYTQTGETWQENRKEIIEQLEVGSQVKRRQRYDDILRQYLDL